MALGSTRSAGLQLGATRSPGGMQMTMTGRRATAGLCAFVGVLAGVAAGLGVFGRGDGDIRAGDECPRRVLRSRGGGRLRGQCPTAGRRGRRLGRVHAPRRRSHPGRRGALRRARLVPRRPRRRGHARLLPVHAPRIFGDLGLRADVPALRRNLRRKPRRPRRGQCPHRQRGRRRPLQSSASRAAATPRSPSAWRCSWR